MLIASGIRGRLDLSDLRQGSIGYIGEVLRNWNDVIGIRRGNRLAPLKILHVAQSEQARRIVGRSGAGAEARVDVNLPGDARALQLLKNRGGVDQSRVTGICADWVRVASRGCSDHVFAVRLRPRHRRIEPAV